MKDITHQIMQMQAMVHRAIMRGVDQEKVSAGQPKVLAFLKNHEGLSQKDIAKACQIEPGSLTVLLNRMEALGMVDRRRAEGNRRSRSGGVPVLRGGTDRISRRDREGISYV